MHEIGIHTIEGKTFWANNKNEAQKIINQLEERGYTLDECTGNF